MTTLFAAAFISVTLVAFIWIAYPIAIWFLARAMPQRHQLSPVRGFDQRTSVVLATRESAELIERRIKNLLETDFPGAKLDVVVALDAGGAHATIAELSHLDPRVRVVLGDQPGGKASTLNAGVRTATGDVIVFADSAQIFDRRTLPELLHYLDDERFGAVSGALTLGGAEHGTSPVHAYWRLEKWLRHNESMLHSSIGVTGAVYAVRRELWPVLPVGTLLDDVYVPMSIILAGHRVGFTYAARAIDVRAFGSDAEAVRKTRTLTGVLQLLHLLPDLMSTKNPVRIQFVMHKLARLATPFLLAVFAGASASMLLLFMMRYPQQALPPLIVFVIFVSIVPPLRRVCVGGIRWLYVLQMATVRALNNGLRARWSVWQDPK